MSRAFRLSLPAALAAAILAIAAPSASALTASNLRTVFTMVTDMNRSSEALPEGVPLSMDWASHPRIAAGNDATGYSAFIPWGQLYECSSGNPQPAVRTELFSLRAFIRSKATGLWHQVDGPEITGGAFLENYASDNRLNVPTDATIGGGLSVPVGNGRNFHFWSADGRVPIDPADVGSVAVVVRARLVASTVDPNLPPPCVVLSVGADYWDSPTARWAGVGGNNVDVGIGRFKRVDLNWRVFTMTTASLTQLIGQPVPVLFPRAELR